MLLSTEAAYPPQSVLWYPKTDQLLFADGCFSRWRAGEHESRPVVGATRSSCLGGQGCRYRTVGAAWREKRQVIRGQHRRQHHRNPLPFQSAMTKVVGSGYDPTWSPDGKLAVLHRADKDSYSSLQDCSKTLDQSGIIIRSRFRVGTGSSLDTLTNPMSIAFGPTGKTWSIGHITIRIWIWFTERASR